MNTGKRKSGKKAIGIAMAAIMIASIFGMIVPAFGFHNVPVPPGDEGIYLLNPRNSGESYCNSVTIDVWVNSSVADLKSGKVSIETSDKSCANIIGCWCNGTQWPQSHIGTIKDGGKWVILSYAGTGGVGIQNPPGNYPIGTITVHCNSSTGCLAGLDIIPEKPNSQVVNDTLPLPESFGVTGESGTFTCTAAEETYSKELVAGWNLISLPLTPSNNSAAKVLENVSYNAVYRYSATPPKKFVSVSTMDPWVGYFVNVTAPDQTWTYNGTENTSINVSLESGLNMVGWPNCSLNITGSDDALSSLLGKYNYVARFNATSQKFEAYNPHAPQSAGFNDFDLMEPGTGYFISARPDCPRLVKDCPTS